MILDKVQPETREDSNIFSFAGRVALIGGSAIGIYKTMEESKAIEESKRLAMPVLDKSKTGIVQKLIKDHYKTMLKNYESDIEKMLFGDDYDPSFGSKLNAAIEKEYDSASQKTRHIGLGIGEEDEYKSFRQKLENTVGTGDFDFDRNLPDYIDKMKAKMKSFNGISYTEDAGEITSINFKFNVPTGDGSGEMMERSFSVSPRSKSGFIKTTSQAGDTYYSMAGGILTGMNGDKPVFESTGSYVLKNVLENSEDFEQSVFSVSKLKAEANKIAVFGGYSADQEEAWSNRHLTKDTGSLTNSQILRKSRFMLDPQIKGDKRDLIEKMMTDAGYAGGGEKSLAKGVFVGPDVRHFEDGSSVMYENPLDARMGARESITGQSVYKDSVVKSFDGPEIPEELLRRRSLDGTESLFIKSNDVIRANVLTIVPEMQQDFLETAKLYGSTVHHLPDEEMIYNKQYSGLIEDSIRSEKILMSNSEHVSPLMRKVLEEVRGLMGEDATLEDVFSAASSKGGLQIEGLSTLRGMREEMLSDLAKEKNAVLEQLRIKKNEVIAATGEFLDPYSKLDEAQKLEALKLRFNKRDREVAKKQMAETGKENALLNVNRKKAGIKLSDYPEDVQVKIKELEALKKETKRIQKEYKTKRKEISKTMSTLGVNQSGQMVGVNNSIAGNSITSIFWDQKNKTMRLGLTRPRGFGNGMKITGLKAIMSDSIDVPTVLAHMTLEKEGVAREMIKGEILSARVNEIRKLGITQVSFADPIASMKKADKFSRMAASSIDSIVMKYLDSGDNDPGLAAIFKKHGLVGGASRTKDYRVFLSDLGSYLNGGQGGFEDHIETALRYAKKEIGIGSNKTLGFLTSHIVGIEKDMADMGAGKLGTLSTRGLLNLSSFGLNETMSELYGRRIDKGLPMLQALMATKADQMIESNKVAGVSIERFGNKDITELFNRKSDDVLGLRNSFLKANFAGELTEEGNLIVNLGEKFNNKKMVIYGNKALNSYIGKGHSGKGFTELENATLALFANAKWGREADPRLYDRWKNAHKEMVESIAKNVFKGKVSGSMYGQLNSLKLGAGSQFEDMSQAMAKKLKMSDADFRKKYGGNVLFMHEDDIIRQYGVEALKKVRKGDYYGIFSREPNESKMSTVPVAIMSAEEANPEMRKFAHTQRIYIGENDSILRAVFGDTDGDFGSVIAANTSEVRDFVTGKTAQGRAFRQVQKELASAASSIKGQSKGHILGDLIMTPDERIAFNKLIAQTGKEKIGVVSNQISQLHNAYRTKLASAEVTEELAKTVYRGEAAAHFFVENILKAKYMSNDDIMKNKADRILAMLMGSDDYAESKNASKLQRAAAVSGFFEQIVFGDSGSMRQLSSMAQATEGLDGLVARTMNEKQIKILKSGNTKSITRMLTNAMKGEGVAEDLRKVSELLINSMSETGDGYEVIHKKIGTMSTVLSQKTVDGMIDAADAGKKLGKTKDVVMDMIDLAVKLTKDGTLDDSMMAAYSKAAGASLIDTGKALLKNVGLFGVLPAAALGFMSAVTDSPKNIQIEESKRQQVKRNNSSYFMQGSKYRSEIIGSLDGSDQLYSDFGRARENNGFNGGSFRLVDHSSNIDPFEIRDIVSNNFY
jgi:hypothetical protein